MTERVRVAVVNGKEYPFHVSVTRDMIRELLTQQLGVSKKEIYFKPGTYLWNNQSKT